MKKPTLTLSGLLLVGLLWSASPPSSDAKGYSSGGGRSYSSSRSSGSSSSRSWSASASRPAGSGRRSFDAGSGRSYASGSRSNDEDRRGYGSGKSYASATGRLFSSRPGLDTRARPAPAREPAPGSSSFAFDVAAARASEQQASQHEYRRFQQAQAAVAPPQGSGPQPSLGGLGSQSLKPSGLPSRDHSSSVLWPSSAYRSTPYYPSREVLISRPFRLRSVFEPYYARPVVVYRDSYSSFFWWWLLDRSLEDRAWWAYHHRYDMDPARYQAMVASDQQLEARVQQLESQQAQRDPAFVPTGLDRDLMYSDRYVARAYENRPTLAGRILFFLVGVPAAIGLCCFFIWLIWFKRW